MATCVVCGEWAGVGKNKHDVDCTPVPIAQPTAEDLFIAKLTPVIRSAAVRGGVAGAFTMAALLVAIGVIFAIVRALI